MADVMPVRTSTNKVEGINRCECGNVRTIHRARGKRAKFLYSICDDCGTNQQTGAYWQDKFKVHYPTLEALHQAEQAAESVVSEPKPEPKAEPVPEPKPAPQLTEPEAIPVPAPAKTEPKQPEPEPENKPSIWKAVLTGIILGGLTGGAITRL
ncbi:hypothetical protein [Photobacterium sp. TY1-4]|uniref:hypothetical protein n=1 Tax=Photobacterium sp. TY1-4 TaxID=2899122 RepID=UPI0021BF30AD|nr:hypothetical protein [Photobacterium sp. TY1-4]UXI04657.1 hypothetical protein NH461_18510 [Photobacterium sp. TY1-4]